MAPIVADALGQLFNKQAVLEHLLAAKAVAAATSSAPASAQPLALPAAVQTQQAAVAGATPVVADARSTAGSIVAYPAPLAAAGATGAAAPPKELAAACLRYENQQRAAAAAAAASGGASAGAQGTFDHIRSLKDVFLVQLTSNPDAGHPSTAVAAATAAGPSASAAAAAQGAHAGLSIAGANGISNGNSNNHSEDLPSPWMCPVTLQPCGSKQPFSALKPCGHVLSQKALMAIIPAEKRKSSKATQAVLLRQDSVGLDEDGLEGLDDGMTCRCPVCEVPFDPEKDVVLIGGSQQHMDAVRERVLAAAAAKVQAKQKKRKRVAGADIK